MPTSTFDPIADPCIRARELLALLGGPAKATRALAAQGWAYPEATVRSWQHRGIMPLGALVAVKATLQREGVQIDVDDFLLEPEMTAA